MPSLECKYSLHWYPFDTQNCFLDIRPTSDLEDFIQLTVNNFIYEGPMDLSEYSVQKIDMRIEKIGNHSKLIVELFIQTKLCAAMIRVLPCLNHYPDDDHY